MVTGPGRRLFQRAAKGGGNAPALEVLMDVQPVQVAAGGVHVPKAGQLPVQLGYKGQVRPEALVPGSEVRAAGGGPGVQLRRGVMGRVDGVDRLVKEGRQRGAVVGTVGPEGHGQRVEPGVRLGPAVEGEDLPAAPVSLQHGADGGYLGLSEVEDVLQELCVQLLLHPGHIGAQAAAAVLHPRQADVQRVIQEKGQCRRPPDGRAGCGCNYRR